MHISTFRVVIKGLGAALSSQRLPGGSRQPVTLGRSLPAGDFYESRRSRCSRRSRSNCLFHIDVISEFLDFWACVTVPEGGWSGPASFRMMRGAAALKHATRRDAVAKRPCLTATTPGIMETIRPGRRNGPQPNQETVSSKQRAVRPAQAIAVAREHRRDPRSRAGACAASRSAGSASCA
jgi:hypothetical protein